MGHGCLDMGKILFLGMPRRADLCQDPISMESWGKEDVVVNVRWPHELMRSGMLRQGLALTMRQWDTRKSNQAADRPRLPGKSSLSGQIRARPNQGAHARSLRLRQRAEETLKALSDQGPQRQGQRGHRGASQFYRGFYKFPTSLIFVMLFPPISPMPSSLILPSFYLITSMFR